MSPQHKAFLLAEIERLKKEKPPHWKGDIREILRALARAEDPFREHEYHGNESAGRRSLPVRSPPW